MVVGGTQTAYSTGAAPFVGIDPSLNWAVISPGGAGAINIVDLGFGSSSAGSGGRAPAVIATAGISTTLRGIAINPENHTALLSDYNTGNLYTFSLLDNSVNSVTYNGVGLTYQGPIAAAVNPLQNVGIAVNALGSGTAEVVDLGNHIVLQQVTGLTSSLGEGSPQAVAVDPQSNEALIVNEGALSGTTRAAGSIATVSLGTVAAKPLQILQSSPAITYTTSPSGSALAMTITGTGFTGTSGVLLDGLSLSTLGGAVTDVSAREITATIPASMLNSARRYAVQIQNGAAVSNVEPLIVIQAVTVGTSPAGVAVDPYRDLAVVTNSGSGSVSLVSVAPPSISPLSLGLPGVIGLPLVANDNPRAVAVNPREGLAVVANYASNDLTLVDYSNLDLPAPYSLGPYKGCASDTVCTGPAGVAFNLDNTQFLVTDTNVGTTTSDVAYGAASGAATGTPPTFSSPVTPQPVDQTPGDIAIAPSFDPFDPINNPNPSLSFAAIASSAQTSVVDFINLLSEIVVGRTTGVSLPTGITYDSLNRVFLVSDSLNNNLMIVNPLTFVPVFVRGGFNPSSIAYNEQTSTIVTVDDATGTLSVLDYLCPPATATPACTAPQVRATIGLVGSQISSTAPLGPHTVDIDPLLDLAILVDSENNRVLLIPLP
jgi:DNA-binding beta-propeller fold protein YncE